MSSGVRTLALVVAAAAGALAVYTDEFALCVDGHGEAYARKVAEKHGFRLKLQVSPDFRYPPSGGRYCVELFGWGIATACEQWDWNH